MPIKINSVTGEAVTLAEAQDHMRIDVDNEEYGEEDALLSRMINSATEAAENFTGRSLREKEITLALDAFCDKIVLPKGPVQGIDSVVYVDTDGEDQEVEESDYVLDDFGDVHSLRAAFNTTWPDHRAEPNAVRVTYTAGYADGQVPDAVRSAILMMVADQYRNREAQVEKPLEMNETVQNLLMPYRIEVGI